MPKIEVNFEPSLKQFTKTIENLNKRVHYKINRIIESEAETIIKFMRLKSRYKTGRLRSGWTKTTRSQGKSFKTFTIINNIPYALYTTANDRPSKGSWDDYLKQILKKRVQEGINNVEKKINELLVKEARKFNK